MNKGFKKFIFFYFLIVFCVLNTFQSFSFQQTNQTDSIKLEKYSSILSKINPNQIDSIILIANHAIEDFRNDNKAFYVCKLNQNTGSILLRYGYFNLAEKYYEDALKVARELNNKPLEIDILLSVGVIWGRKGDFVKSESYFLNALLLSQKANYPKGIANAYFKMGVIRTRQNKVAETQMYYNKVDSVNKSNKTDFLKFDLINNKAIYYAMQGDLDNALKQFELSYRLAVEGKKPIDQVLALQNIGLVYKERSDYQNALKYLNKGVQLANKYGLKEEKLRVAIIIPAILTEQKKYSEAEEALKEYLNQSLKLEIIDLSSEIYDNLIGISKEKGDYKSALTYFQQNTELKEKQINQEKQRALAEANASLGLYTANQKVLESETLLFQKTREKNILIIGLVFSSILTIGLFIVLYRLKKLNHALNISKAELTESNSVKNKLFSIIGHDLRGSQGTTLGVLSLIDDDELDAAEQKKYIKTIIKQTTSSLAILDDLLLWGQAQIKGKSLEKHIISILPVVQNTIDLNLKTIIEKSLTINPIDLEGKNVFMDTNHFSFVIRNLLANAIKFTPSGGKIEIKAENHGNTQYKISITDNGIGIPDDELKSIFTPDSTSRKGTKDEKGTGLGLTLCHEFVKANGGEIWAEKNVEKGTILCFTVDKGV